MDAGAWNDRPSVWVKVAVRMKVSGWLRGGVLVVGAVAVEMEATNLQSPARPALVVAFVIFAPLIAIGGQLSGFDPLARALLAFSSCLVLLTVVAMVMVLAGIWNATGGLLVLAGISTVCLAARWPRRHDMPARRGTPLDGTDSRIPPSTRHS